MFELILKMRPKYPRSFSKHLRDLISKLLTHQKKRLGNSKAGWDDLKKHMWLAGFDWDGLVARTVKPPLKPMSKIPEAVEDPCTLDKCEAPDVPPCPEWYPYLPKTLHKWRDAKDPAMSRVSSGKRLQ